MLTWVMMTDDGPQVCGIALEGIFVRKGPDPAMFGAYDRSPTDGSRQAAWAEPGQSLGVTSVPNLRDRQRIRHGARACFRRSLAAPPCRPLDPACGPSR